jgi:hypothetical protein
MSTINSVSSLVSSLQQQMSSATSAANNSIDFSKLLQGIHQVIDQAFSATTTTTTNTSTTPVTPSIDSSTNTSASTSTTTAVNSTTPVTSNSPTGEKPSLKDFMAMTGADIDTAVKYLYGSVGAFTDYRDWSAIKASSNPLQTTQQAISDMFIGANAPSQAAQLTQAGYKPIDQSTILAQQGQLALVQEDQQSPNFRLMTKEGFAFSAPIAPSDMNGVSDQMKIFGVETSNLNNLLTKLDQSKQALPANYPESTWTQLLSRLNVTWSNGAAGQSIPA